MLRGMAVGLFAICPLYWCYKNLLRCVMACKGNNPQPQAHVISVEYDSVAVCTRLILCTVATLHFTSYKVTDLNKN
jgi:hypothetical protein